MKNLNESDKNTYLYVVHMKKLILIALSVLTGIILIADANGVKTAAANSVMLCLNTIIPSLFAFMALSVFVTESGILKGETAVFILSIIGGYPVGAKLLTNQIKNNPAYKKRGETLLCFCYCGSPALLGAICDYGIVIWISNALACLIFAVIINLFSPRKKESVPDTPQSNPQPLSTLLISSVTQAGGALYKICLMIVLFAVGMRMAELSGVMRFLPKWVYAFAEITNLTKIQTSPALTATLTSLGGLCVMLQVSAVTEGRLNLGKFLLSRIPVAMLSGALCWLFTKNAVVQASTIVEPPAVITTSVNPIASLCLMIMTAILIHGERKRIIKNE